MTRRAAVQIDRCDQLTHYLSKFHTPSSTTTAASNGPSTEVTAIDGYVVSSHRRAASCELCSCMVHCCGCALLCGPGKALQGSLIKWNGYP